MDVEIDDADPPNVPPDLQITGRDRNIVEKAEAEGLTPFSMVTRRAHSAEGVIDLPLHEHIDCVENAAHSEQGCLVGLRADLVVGAVQFAKILQAGLLEP